MSMKFRRIFTEAERQAYVMEVLESGTSIFVSKKYDINKVLLSRWVCNYRKYHQTLAPKDKKEKEIIPNYKKAYNKLKNDLLDKELEIAVLRDLLKKKVQI